MPDILIRDKVWVRAMPYMEDDGELERQRGEVVIVKPDGSECIVALDNGTKIRVPVSFLELRETHE